MRSHSSIWWVAGVAIALVSGLVGVSVMASRQQQAARDRPVGADATLQAARNVRGAAGARVELVEYGDYL